MTPLIKEMVKMVSVANLDPTQMQWFDVPVWGSFKQWQALGANTAGNHYQSEKMTQALAKRILDRVKEGRPTPLFLINLALKITGDL